MAFSEMLNEHVAMLGFTLVLVTELIIGQIGSVFEIINKANAHYN